MTEAFKCDGCGKLFEGKVPDNLTKLSRKRDGHKWRVFLSLTDGDGRKVDCDLCVECQKRKIREIIGG